MVARRPSSRSKRVVALSMPPTLRLAYLCLAFVAFPLWLYSSWWTSKRVNSPAQTMGGLSKRLGSFAKHRVGIIIPFIGEGPESIPPYLELFCTAAAGSAALVDFLLIHNGVLNNYRGDACPDNVIFISLEDTLGFSKYLMRVIDQKDDEETAVGGSKEKLVRILSTHIVKYPYVLVEFKPALGHIFADFLHGYSHWGYSDLDILFGDLPRWITPDELNDFDIVTYGFGDQDRLYLRGQFTFHKNVEKVNQIWRQCEYLSHMDKRFADVMSGNQHLHFESAEGCYSAAVLESTGLKVKYAVKAFTDVNVTDTAYSHGLYVGTGKQRSRTVLYKAGDREGGKALSRLPDTWFENANTLYDNPNKPLLFEVGERTRIPSVEKKDAKCMFWAQKKYQARLCIDNVQPTDTVFWIDGQLYKQKYEKAVLPGRIESAPFFHFQEWKRYYRSTQLAGLHRSGPVRTIVLCKEGVIPAYPVDYKGDKNYVASPLGLSMRKWQGVKNDDRQQLPGQSYCLRSGPRKVPPSPPAPHCRFSTSWRDKDVIEILSPAPAWGRVDAQVDVTLLLTLQIQAEQVENSDTVAGFLELLGEYLDRWKGQPSVVLIHMAGATTEAAQKLRIKLGVGSDLSFGLETCLVGAIFTENAEFISRKAMMNMVLDAAPTRWTISGFELERGVAMSHDTGFFAHRVSRVHDELPGSVFVLPQFGLVNEDDAFTLPELWKAKDDDNLRMLSKVEGGQCEGGEDSEAGDDGSYLFEPILKLWWQMSERLIAAGLRADANEAEISRMAQEMVDIQLSMIGLLTEAKHYSLFATDVSPILLMDNIGPRSGMITSDIAREVEEFGGKQCYNALRLAQLATMGYKINILAGGFALSTPKTRKVALADIPESDGTLGTSRCDGCFMFDEDHEDILEDISTDERKRPAKAALLWDHSMQSESLLDHS